MGTNYYRIETEAEMLQRKEKLQEQISNLDMSPSNIEREFSIFPVPDSNWETTNPWADFLKGTSVHLGKRSGGWLFCWNFHKNKYYSNKEELFAFIRSGRVVDEYGTELSPDEFIEMALNWCPGGWDTEAYYKEHPSHYIGSHHYDIKIDGLRVSPATEFC